MEVKMSMKKKIKRSKLVKVLKTLKIDAIVPFKEKPSDTAKEKKDSLDASELFSFFTADIIKEDIEFVR
jgi:arsenate reductase-like glutaredoxin family protein